MYTVKTSCDMSMISGDVGVFCASVPMATAGLVFLQLIRNIESDQVPPSHSGRLPAHATTSTRSMWSHSFGVFKNLFRIRLNESRFYFPHLDHEGRSPCQCSRVDAVALLMMGSRAGHRQMPDDYQTGSPCVGGCQEWLPPVAGSPLCSILH